MRIEFVLCVSRESRYLFFLSLLPSMCVDVMLLRIFEEIFVNERFIRVPFCPFIFSEMGFSIRYIMSQFM